MSQPRIPSGPRQVPKDLEHTLHNSTANWMTLAFGESVHKSKAKQYLFRLMEFNKAELNRHDSFL